MGVNAIEKVPAAVAVTVPNAMDANVAVTGALVIGVPPTKFRLALQRT